MALVYCKKNIFSVSIIATRIIFSPGFNCGISKPVLNSIVTLSVDKSVIEWEALLQSDNKTIDYCFINRLYHSHSIILKLLADKWNIVLTQ